MTLQGKSVFKTILATGKAGAITDFNSNDQVVLPVNGELYILNCVEHK